MNRFQASGDPRFSTSSKTPPNLISLKLDITQQAGVHDGDMES